MKKRNKLILSMLLMVTGISLGIVNNQGSSVRVVKAVTESLNEGLEGDPINTDKTAKEYYSSISSSLTGDSLKVALYNLIHPKKCSTGYSSIWNYLPYCDADPDNPESNKIIAFYRDEAGFRSEMNKEHVWPKSRGGAKIDGDPHMVRPTYNSDNSGRGNDFYNEKPTSYDPSSLGSEKYRGIAARIIFYCAVQEYKSLTLVDKTTDGTVSTTQGTMGKLSTLLKWNLEYPIDDTEILRNEVLSGARKVKGKSFNFNRNPFIDDRTLACKIWGDYNESTKNVCSKVLQKDPPTSLTISPSEATVNVGSSVNLSVSATPSNASTSVTWVSSNLTVASVSSGVVTGLSEGTTTISAISTMDSSVRAEITITVRDVKSISISGTPTKTTYEEGEKFDPNGLTVTAKYSDNTTSIVSNSSITWLDGVTLKETLSKGTTSVVAKCGSVQTIYNGITVNEKTTPDGCVLVNSTSELESGDEVVIAYKEGNKIAGELSEKNYLISADATFSADKQTLEDYSNGLIFTLEKSNSNWTLSNEGNKLGTSSAKSLTFSGGTTKWNISVSSGEAKIKSTNSDYGSILYNTSAPRFWNYTSDQASINLYKVSKSSINPDPTPDPTPIEKTLVELTIEGLPTKLSYYEGDSFDSTGVNVLATFSNGDVENVTSDMVWTPNKLSLSDNKVTGTYTYNGVTLSVDVKNIFVSKKISNDSNKGCGKASMNIMYLIALISFLGVIIKKK